MNIITALQQLEINEWLTTEVYPLLIKMEQDNNPPDSPYYREHKEAWDKGIPLDANVEYIFDHSSGIGPGLDVICKGIKKGFTDYDKW